MTAYYNEFDPFAAAWLRNLISENLIAPGDVDERSILDVPADDLRGYTQCHFFAGIGGWSYALRLAGWPDDRPVWTGSCPCQPLSSAGKQKGHDDERHLWPAFYELIAECRPSAVYGEQVASKLGREWLAGVRADLEDARYAVGAADLCAAGVGAPHMRQRLFWMADARRIARGLPVLEGGSQQAGSETERGREVGGLADTDGRHPGKEREQRRPESGGRGAASGRGEGGVEYATSEQRDGRADTAGPSGRGGAQDASPWSNATYIPCADGKARRIEPSIQPLAHGIPNRVGTLRGAGNAIVPQVAAAFVRAADET